MVSESENIVAETAARIFADLADPQTVNRAGDTAWTAPLWRALEQAGLPLAWASEAQGGASLADGFAILGAAGRYAIPVPLAETLIAGWLLAQADIEAPTGAMTVAPARPRDRVTLNADGSCERLMPRDSLRPRLRTHRGHRRRRQRRDHRFGQNRRLPSERRRKSRRRALRRRELRAREADPQRAGSRRFRSIGADADGRDRAQRRDRRCVGNAAVAQRRLRQRARRLRAADRQIPGGAAEPGAACRRDRGRARRRRLRRRHHRDVRQFRRHGAARSSIGENSLRRGRRRRRSASRTRCTAPSASPTSTSCIASRCACCRGATISAAKAIGRRRSARWSRGAAPTSSGPCWRRVR